jgi:cytoskeletal protein CcmA (bactofilin family)
MKNTFNALVLLILVSLGYSTEFSVQGVLRDPLGRTVDDGQYSVTFKIYDDASSGSALWTEEHESVSVQHGIFTELLGGITAMDNLAFNTTYWIGISVDEGDEMSPRTQLTTSPYSKSVFGTDNVFPSVGNIGVGILAPDAAFHVKTKESNEADIFLIEDSDGVPQVQVSSNGYLGINNPTLDGESVIGAPLSINGSLQLYNGGTLIFSDGSSISTALFGGSVSSLANQGTINIAAVDESALIKLLIATNEKVVVSSDLTDIKTSLTVDGATIVSNTLDVTGATTLSGDLEVEGGSIFNDQVTMKDWLDVYGDLDANRIFVNGNTFLGANVDIDDDLEVMGSTTIGGSSPSSTLTVTVANASQGKFYVKNSGDNNNVILQPGLNEWGYLGDNSNRWWSIHVWEGNANAWNTYSDSRLKENIRFLNSEETLEKLLTLRGVQYDAKEGTPLYTTSENALPGDNENILGVIAQEVEKVFPGILGSESGGYKTVQYDKFVPVFIEAIKQIKIEKDKEIEELKKEYDALLARIVNLENQ